MVLQSIIQHSIQKTETFHIFLPRSILFYHYHCLWLSFSAPINHVAGCLPPTWPVELKHYQTLVRILLGTDRIVGKNLEVSQCWWGKWCKHLGKIQWPSRGCCVWLGGGRLRKTIANYSGCLHCFIDLLVYVGFFFWGHFLPVSQACHNWHWVSLWSLGRFLLACKFLPERRGRRPSLIWRPGFNMMANTFFTFWVMLGWIRTRYLARNSFPLPGLFLCFVLPKTLQDGCFFH